MLPGGIDEKREVSLDPQRTCRPSDRKKTLVLPKALKLDEMGPVGTHPEAPSQGLRYFL
jgi:hypothetical protein